MRHLQHYYKNSRADLHESLISIVIASMGHLFRNRSL